jgi:hypothetical protein
MFFMATRTTHRDGDAMLMDGVVEMAFLACGVDARHRRADPGCLNKFVDIEGTWLRVPSRGDQSRKTARASFVTGAAGLFDIVCASVTFFEGGPGMRVRN